MDVAAFLEEVCAIPGHSGMEGAAAARIAQEFSKYTKDVFVDKLGSVHGVMGSRGPRVLVCAHMDEVGLIAGSVADNGFIRLWQLGGVDPRTLPGCEVTVWGKKPLYGVIGALPPHLSQGPLKAADTTELAVDVGLPKEEVEALVRTGDPVYFKVPMTRLLNDRVAYKTFDDRACVTSMILAMEELQNYDLPCTVEFCATVQEEVGSFGAMTAAYARAADMGVAFDVCHATTPGTDPWETMPMEKVGLGMGPTIHPAMLRRMQETAQALRVDTQIDPSSGRTYTDADSIFCARAGIPTALLSLPLSYMHTMVETISLKSCREAGRLLAGFLKGVDERWEDWLCF